MLGVQQSCDCEVATESSGDLEAELAARVGGGRSPSMIYSSLCYPIKLEVESCHPNRFEKFIRAFDCRGCRLVPTSPSHGVALLDMKEVKAVVELV